MGAAVLVPLAIAGASTALQLLLAPKVKQQPVDKGKFDDIRITGSDYGAFIPRIWGTARLGGNIIFSSGVDHQVINTPGSGGKGVPSSPPTRTHIYRTDAGVLFARGLLGSYNRVWADTDVLFSASTPSDSNTVEAENATATGTVTQINGGAVPNRATDAYITGINSGEYLTFNPSLSLPAAPDEPDIPIPYTYAIIYYKCSTPMSVSLSANSGAWTETRTFFPASDNGWTTTFVEVPLFVTSFKYGGQASDSPDIDFIEFNVFYQSPNGTFRNSYVITGIKNPDISYPGDELAPTGLYNFVPTPNAAGEASLTTATGNAIRYYLGSATQTADSSLTAWLDTRFPPSGGAARAPGFRNLGYIVFDNYVLKNGRLPNFTAEVTGGRAATAKNIIEDILTEVGLTSANWNTTSAGSLSTDGFVETTQSTRRALLEPLLRWHQLALAEIDGKITVVTEGDVTSSYTVVPNTDLRAHPYESEPPPYDAHISKKEETQIPKRVRVSFMNPALEYHNETVQSDPIYTTSATETKEFTFPIVSDAATASVVANQLHAHEIVRDKVFELECMPTMARYAVGDVLTLTIDGRAYTLQIIRKTVQIPVGVIRLECVAQDKPMFDALGSDLKDLTAQVSPVSPALEGIRNIVIPRNSKMIVTQDARLYEKDQGRLGVYVAVSGQGRGDWENAAVYRETSTGNYELAFIVDSPSPMGVTASTVGSHTDTSEEQATTVTLNFYDDVELETVTQAELFQFPALNLLNIGGEWVQFRTASENALAAESPYKSSWDVSNLWRGRFTNNPAIAGEPKTSGTDVFLVNNSLKFMPFEATEIGETINLKAVTNGQSVDDAPIVSFTAQNPFPLSNVTSYDDITTTGTSTEYLLSVPLGSNPESANPFPNVGDVLLVEAGGTFAANTNQKLLGFRFDSQDVGSLDTTQSGGAWQMRATVTRVDGGNCRVVMESFTDTPTEHWVDYATFAADAAGFFGGFTVKVWGRTTASAGDLTIKQTRVTRVPVDYRRATATVTSGGVTVTVAGTEVTV